MTGTLLRGRTVLVTGAGRGIGKAVAQRSAEEGAALVIADINGSELQLVADQLQSMGNQVSALTGDLTEERFASELPDAARTLTGRLDAIVNNAGIEHRATIEDHERSDWERVIAVNLTAPFLVVRAALPLLSETSGSVVNIASTAVTGFRGQVAYDTSKGGILSMTRSMAAELGRKGIRVNAVSPGFIATDMVLGNTELTQLGERQCRTQPITRMGRPDEIAAAVVWLLSDQASYITGQNIFVDGGWIRS